MGSFRRFQRLNQLDHETITGYNVQATRISLDDYINKRGKIVINLMEEMGLCTLVELKGDTPENFTFANANGKSTISGGLKNLPPVSYSIFAAPIRFFPILA